MDFELCSAMCKIVLGFVIILISVASQAQLRCNGVHLLDSLQQRRAQADRLFKNKLVGPSQDKPSEFFFYWHSAYPFQLRKISEAVYQTVFSDRRMVLYSNSSDSTTQSGLSEVNTFFGRQGLTNQELLQSYLQVYRQSADPRIIQSIEALEQVMQAIADDRQSFGLVATGPASMGGELKGTFRIYNGVPSHSASPAYLPLEYSLAKNKLKSKTAQKLEEMRQQNPNVLIFELGRLSIQGSPEEVERTKALLDLFLLRKYLDVLPDDALFYAHCATKVLARANQQHYGFKIVEEIEVPGKGTQYILETTAGKIREIFEKRYGLNSSGIQILHP